MSILNFVTLEEIDELDDDPRVAFVTFVSHAQRRFSEQLRDLDSREQWQEITEVRHSFMNVVTAAAKRFEIEPFAAAEVPRLAKFDDRDYGQFKADLDHYVTQLMLDNSIRAKRDSVAILPISKDRIRNYVRELRKCIEQANMTEPKREALLKKLDIFETELEKRRLNLLAAARIAFELLAIPGAVWTSADVAHKLITNVMQVVAEAKSAEHETRQLAPVEATKALSPPRHLIEDRRPAAVGGGRSADLDDDIPF